VSLLLNILALTIHWKVGLLKTGIAAVKAPLPPRRDQGEARS